MLSKLTDFWVFLPLFFIPIVIYSVEIYDHIKRFFINRHADKFVQESSKE